MDVDIEGKGIRLEQQQIVGVGGEGTVFLANVSGQQMAVKVYHTPTPQRQEKLLALLASRWNFPANKVMLPLQAVRDTQLGKVLGFTMPYLGNLGTGFVEIARLANRKHRAAYLVSTRQVASIFLDGAMVLDGIHAAGLVVGDLNDQNIFYKQEMMLWIDVDAWQFSHYACPVGSEDFLAPELYGIDLSLQPFFKPEHDWYAFAVHLFRSLLLAHPYGGTHPTVHLLTQRAQQRLFVLNPAITYPRIAHSAELLSDDLAHTFHRIFVQGWRGRFPLALLQQYYDTLVECPACKMYVPHRQGICPLCQVKTVMPLQQSVVSAPASGLSVTELLRTKGKFVFSKLQGDTLWALAYEDEKAVLYSKKSGQEAVRKELFKELPGVHYDLLDAVLIVNLPETATLLFLDIAGTQPIPLFQAETGIFAGRRQAQFQTSGTHLYSIGNNALVCSRVEERALSSRALRTVMEKQTWFTVASASGRGSSKGKATVFGFFQVFRQQLYWPIRDRAVYDVSLSLLDVDESLIDIAAYFSDAEVFVRRHTQERGVDYLRTEVIDDVGKVLYTSARIKQADHPCPNIHGLVYAAGIVLHPTDQGIVQEKIEQGTFKTFSTTHNGVQEGDILELYQSGLLIIGEDRVNYLVL